MSRLVRGINRVDGRPGFRGCITKAGEGFPCPSTWFVTVLVDEASDEEADEVLRGSTWRIRCSGFRGRR